MRDAFGGAFMIQIFLIFILIYIAFTAMALNYAKAFKVKNVIIDYLENAEISNLDDMPASELEALETFIEDEILGNMNYNLSGQKICQEENIKEFDEDTGKRIAICHESGIVIEMSGKSNNAIYYSEEADYNSTEGVYYTVSTYVGWSIPFINNLLSLNGNNQEQEVAIGRWKISGQTRLIVNE